MEPASHDRGQRAARGPDVSADPRSSVAASPAQATAGRIMGVHPAAIEDEELLRQCDLGRSRASGPGGQHRNKVETKVTLTHRPTGISAQASERRSAEENRRVALFRLRLALAIRVRGPVPDGDARSALWRERCRAGRIACNPEHRDFPALLAEALDMIEACGQDARGAALRLECSPTQLIRLVKDHPPAFEAWNAHRKERGLHALR